MTVFITILVFIIATGYAAVGLGGGSAYLAVLSFWSHEPHMIRPLTWGLNIVAAGIGFVNYYRAGHFSWRFSTPLVIGGIAGGAVGARLPINTTQFGWLLAVTLLLIALKMLFGRRSAAKSATQNSTPWLIYIAVGFVVGVVSGLVGIGGGIILGPIMLAFRQAAVKTSAAMTSLYVALSSAGALGAHITGGGSVETQKLVLFGVVCLVGAYLGSRYGSRKASPRKLELIFGALVLIAAIRLAWISFSAII